MITDPTYFSAHASIDEQLDIESDGVIFRTTANELIST